MIKECQECGDEFDEEELIVYEFEFELFCKACTEKLEQESEEEKERMNAEYYSDRM